MKLKALPRSRAKTAWGLLLDVQRAILAEPKRVDMGVYYDQQRPEDGGPACSTVGCFAGWVTILATQRYHDAGAARAVLGQDLDYETVPKYGNVFNSGHGDRCGDTNPGTKAHARAVVNRITRFMQVNEAKLKARKLQRVNGTLVPR